MFNLQKMMKQAQEMQDKMKDIQSEMEETIFTGTAGGGAVSISCNGKYEKWRVVISPDAAGSDAETLQDLMEAALLDLSTKIASAMEGKMSAITAGLNIPGLKLPF
jgi:DNA-binding YbaB/EbfC family protein